jgi:hypothetical protein
MYRTIIWQCESGEGRLPILGSAALGLGVVFPVFYIFLQVTVWESIFAAVVIGLLLWLNAGPRQKLRFRLYYDQLVVDRLGYGIGDSRKTYPLNTMRGQSIRLKHNPFFGISTVTIGFGREKLQLELYDRDKALRLIIELKNRIAAID